MISGERVKRQRKVQIERGGIVCDDGGLAGGKSIQTSRNRSRDSGDRVLGGFGRGK